MPESKFPQLEVSRKTGSEDFHTAGAASDFDLLDFWQWSTSDLVSNTTRGILAEYIVARAVDGLGSGVRDSWATFDITTPTGIRIEVKSSSYLQSWAQDRLSSISFGILETLAWDPKIGDYEAESRRQADVYVFAVLAHKDKNTVDPMDLAQWEFYVLSTGELYEHFGRQKSVALSRLKALASPVEFHEVGSAVRSKASDGPCSRAQESTTG